MQLRLVRHEDTHAEIYRLFGYNVTENIGMFRGNVTFDANQTFKAEDSKIITSLESVVELVSYQDDVTFGFIAVSMFMFLLAIERVLEEVKKVGKNGQG